MASINVNIDVKSLRLDVYVSVRLPGQNIDAQAICQAAHDFASRLEEMGGYEINVQMNPSDPEVAFSLGDGE